MRDETREVGVGLVEFESIKISENANLAVWGLLLATTLCMVYLYRDEQDQHADKDFLASESLLQVVASELGEPISELRARRTDLLSYSALWRQTLLTSHLYRLHPLLAPFASAQHKVERFSLYILQCYLLLLFLHHLDHPLYTAALLLPWLSDPLIWLLKGRVSKLLLAAFVQTVGVVVCCLTTNMFAVSACLIATFVMNPAWVVVNSSCCKWAGARQVCSDYKAVRKAEK